MVEFPELHPVSSVTELFDTGHLWVQELIAGKPIRFRIDDTNRLIFASRHGRLEPIPPSLDLTVRYLRNNFDRSALRSAGIEPTAIGIVGVATRFEGVPYDFDQLPPFMVTDVWDPDDAAWLPPDVVETVARRLDLVAVNAFEKELVASYTDPNDLTGFDSAWYDGEPAGIVVRNKTGGLACRRNSTARSDFDSLPAEPSAAATATVTPDRVRRAVTAISNADSQLTADDIYDLVLSIIRREEFARFPHSLDESAFRSAAVERTGSVLAELDLTTASGE